MNSSTFNENKQSIHPESLNLDYLSSLSLSVPSNPANSVKTNFFSTFHAQVEIAGRTMPSVFYSLRFALITL